MAKKSVNAKSNVPTSPSTKNGGKKDGTKGHKTKRSHPDSSCSKSPKTSTKSSLSAFFSYAVGIAAIGVVVTFAFSEDEGSCPFHDSDKSGNDTGCGKAVACNSSVLSFHILCCGGKGVENLTLLTLLYAKR